MKTYKQLYDSTIQYNKKYAKNNGRLVKDIDGKLYNIIPNRAAKLITFEFKVKSQSHSNEGYRVRLQFYNMVFGDKPTSSNCVKIQDATTGKPLYFEKINLFKQPVRVRCGCSDFRFRFAWEDRAVQALYGGPPKKYTRKPGSNRPPVNPEHMYGICKHIHGCAMTIQHFFAR